jgi:hypothetical protein
MSEKVLMIGGERCIRADDALECIDTICKVLSLRETPVYTKFTVIVGPKTTCTVSFDGPVSVDEYAALLAHLAYYKQTVVPGEPTTSENLRGELMDAFRKMIGERAAEQSA